MFKIRHILTTTVISATCLTAMPAAAGGGCGYYAFAGAFAIYRDATRRADRYGGYVLELDQSNSPNAGHGLRVVAKGPYSRGRARKEVRRYRKKGIRDAYASYRCFYND